MTVLRPASLRRIEIDRSVALLLALWVLTMISLPIVKWVLGEAALEQGIVVGVLTQTLVVLFILIRAWGWRRTLVTSAVVVVLAWLSEALGNATGFPFGDYSYTEVLQPQVADVPLLIPLAWLMMLPPAWAVAQVITGGTDPQTVLGRTLDRRQVAFVLVSALAFTAWDLFLDPQMVAWNFWQWDNPSGYFGIPWVNFLGWLLVSALITALALPAGHSVDRDRSTPLPVSPLLVVYAITWALESIGQLLFWDLPGPALVGFLAMGAILFWAARKAAKRANIYNRAESGPP
jgi:putative membrane protein